MNINDLTLGQIREIQALALPSPVKTSTNPFIGRRVLVRTYSAGVHIGDLKSADGPEVQLSNALRLWKWEDGGLSLSALANNGIVKGRLNYTGDVFLTGAIEVIPITEVAEKSFQEFVEDKK